MWVMGKKSKNTTKAWEKYDVIVEQEPRPILYREIRLVG